MERNYNDSHRVGLYWVRYLLHTKASNRRNEQKGLT